MKDFKFIFEKYILRQHRIKKYSEIKVEKLFRKLKGDIFVDIGCNIGVYSKLARENFKNVISIDPNPKYNAQLQVAISDHSGEELFLVGNNNGSGDSLIKDPHILGYDFPNGRISFLVKVITFDELNIDADLVKIDVEGAEFDIINGMKLHLPKSLIIELHDERRKEELLIKMLDKGYNYKEIDYYHWYFYHQIDERL